MSFPHSIFEINKLPEPEKMAIYRQLIPPWVFTDYEIDSETFMKAGAQVVRFRCPAGSRSVEITIRYHPHEIDPLLYLHMIDTFNHQLMVLLLVVNDPLSPRYNVDRDLEGHDTQFGTQSRNLPEELRALRDGMAPGQIRRGLRSFGRGVSIFEEFVSRMGHDLFQIEPLFYHNAIIFERYGFAYAYGRQEMESIHRAFLPGGELYQRLDDANPFRSRDAWQTVRKRSWAIHDGILGHPFTGFQMYKRIGIHAGINTFPDSIW
jgi:hypothetical protein